MFNFARTLAKKAESQNWHQDNTQQSSSFDMIPFMQMSHDLMLIIDENGHIMHGNNSLLTMLGTDETGLSSFSFLNIFHQDDHAHIRSCLKSMREHAAQTMDAPSIEFQSRMHNAEGQTRWIHWQAIGQMPNTYLIGRDITHRKEQNETLSLHEQQLREAESIGRLGRWTWHVGQDTIDWSDQTYTIWGVDRDTFQPSFAEIYSMVHEDDQDRMEQTLQRAMINKNDFDVDFSITLPTGEERYIRCEGRCALDADGHAAALYGIMQDMTERALYERQLRTAKDAAEHAYAAKTQFLANMSHELRTPLNAIIGFSEMIESQMFGPLGSEKYADYATDIRQSGAHLLSLISDILDMSKIEAGKYDLDLEEMQISEVVETAVKMVTARAQETGIMIGVSQPFKDSNIIVADRRACLQIFLNILSNAVKFTEKGGKVDMQCAATKDAITVQITDNGIGIPANKLATITSPFEQISSHYTRDHEGSGLGLAITKELIDMHGGTMDIQSQIDEGTTVTITLPTKPMQHDETGLLFED